MGLFGIETQEDIINYLCVTIGCVLYGISFLLLWWFFLKTDLWDQDQFFLYNPLIKLKVYFDSVVSNLGEYRIVKFKLGKDKEGVILGADLEEICFQ